MRFLNASSGKQEPAFADQSECEISRNQSQRSTTASRHTRLKLYHPRMLCFLTLLFSFVLTGHGQASNNQSPRFTDSDLKMKLSYSVWPENTPLSLKCNASGASPMTVLWYKNGAPLQDSDAIFQDSQWNLRLKSPQESDSGIYTCVVSNAYGVAKHNHSLNVLPSLQSAPVLLPGYPKARAAVVGDSVQLECIEEQNGQVSDYRWLKWHSMPLNKQDVDFEIGNFSIIDSRKYEPFSAVIGQDILYGGRLHLDFVSEEDEGFYTCFVSNNLGYTHRTAHLNVTAVSPTAPPEFIIPKEKRQQFFIGTEGGDVKMSCLVRGGPPLKYQWLFEGKTLESDKRHELHEAEIILKKVRASDMGLYSCSIKNAYGSIVQNFRLHIQSKKQSLPVLLPEYPKNKTGIVGETVSLFCAEIGGDYDIMDYRWLKWHNQRENVTLENLSDRSLYAVLSPQFYEISTRQFLSLPRKGISLKLKNLTMDDQGLYTCLVSNSIGFSVRSAFLSVKYPLKTEAPSEPTATITTATMTTTTMTTATITTATIAGNKDSNTLNCYEYKGRLEEDRPVHDGKQCNSRAPCGQIYDKKRDTWKMFCDERELCKRNGISNGGCINVNITGEKLNLCCCTVHLCNKPVSKLFNKSSKTSQSAQQSQLMTLIFLIALIVTFLIMLAILTYRLRRRKTAGMTATIVHSMVPSRKSTKRIIMETKWLKEDV